MYIASYTFIHYDCYVYTEGSNVNYCIKQTTLKL